MGRGNKTGSPQVPQKAAVVEQQLTKADVDTTTTSEKEARFLAALQEMTGVAELTDEGVREAIAKLTPEQKRQLMEDAGGHDLKRDMMVKEENKEDRSLFFKEVNLSAEKAGLPIDKDSDFLSKKASWRRNELNPPCLLRAPSLPSRRELPSRWIAASAALRAAGPCRLVCT